MATDRQLSTNRRNGRNGGGPRSAAGKSRASRNALRHGLSAMKYRPVVPAGEIERLARAICGDDNDQQLFEAALAIAESHLLRRAIKAQQVAVIERLRERTAIALAKGDNSLDLGRTRFLAAWLANWEIERRVPKLLAKYPAKPGDAAVDMSNDPFAGGDLVPIRLKALLEETQSGEEYERACEIAEKCLAQEERGDAEGLEEAIPDLKRLDRYERRAWSQHKRAIREFINIKVMQALAIEPGSEPDKQTGASSASRST